MFKCREHLISYEESGCPECKEEREARYKPYTAWLIECGSPAKWLVSASGKNITLTDDASRALAFPSLGQAKSERDRIITFGVTELMTVTGHLFNCEIDDT